MHDHRSDRKPLAPRRRITIDDAVKLIPLAERIYVHGAKDKLGADDRTTMIAIVAMATGAVPDPSQSDLYVSGVFLNAMGRIHTRTPSTDENEARERMKRDSANAWQKTTNERKR